MSAPRDVVVVLLDSLNRHLLGCYGGVRVRHTEPRPAGAPRGEVHEPPDRFAAVHARPARPARGRARLSVATVGFDRDLGGRDHAPAASGRGHLDDARHRPSAPVRVRRRELPHRFRRLGLPPRPRGRPVAHPARSVVDRRTRASGARRPARSRLRHQPHLVPRRSRLSRPANDDRRGPMARPGAAQPFEIPANARCWSSTSSIPHEPFDTPEPWASRYDADWEGPRLIWPPYARTADEARLTEREGSAPAHAVRIQALDDRPLARTDPRRDRPTRRVGHHGLHPLHRPRPLSRRARDVGEAASSRVPRAGPHPADDRVARRRTDARATRSQPPSIFTRRSATCSACRPSTERTATRWCPCSKAPPPACVIGRSPGCGAVRCT